MAICVQCGHRRRMVTNPAGCAYQLCMCCYGDGYRLERVGRYGRTWAVVSKGGLPIGAAAHLMNKHRQRQRAARAKRPGLFEESV